MLTTLDNVMHRRLARLYGHRLSKLRAFLTLSFLLTAACVGISVGVAFQYLGKVMEYNLPLQGDPAEKVSRWSNSTVVSDPCKVNMAIIISKVDPGEPSLRVGWYPSTTSCPHPSTSINFFFDEYATFP